MKIQLACLILLLTVLPVSSQNVDDTTPTVEFGAEVYWKHCVLCHGSQGMGEGKIPLKIKNYPNTNIVSASKTRTPEEIHDVVVYGGMLPNISKFMPPMGNELTWTEVQSVTMFVSRLRESPEKYYTMLNEYSSVEDTPELGFSIFESRCVLCHGINGEGDGRMARVIKNPPPFNLTQSKMPISYLKLIIEKGGEALGRSGQMPPWGDQLSKEEINAVATYLLSLRK
jgi:cytochrome c oxidase cbb3-type subunit 3